MSKHKFNPDYAVAPGVTLQEILDMNYQTPKLFSITSKLSVEHIHGILDGSEPITFEDADAIALATGTTASFWNNRETTYRKFLAP